MNLSSNRILVAVSPEARERIRRLLPDGDLHFVDSYADADLAVKTSRYGSALLGAFIGEERLKALVMLIRRVQPDVEILCVDAIGPASGKHRVSAELLASLGLEGPIGVFDDMAPPVRDRLGLLRQGFARGRR